MADFHRSLDRALSRALHVIECVACHSEHVGGNYNADGLWYGYCLTCGTRFWARTDHTTPAAQAVNY